MKNRLVDTGWSVVLTDALRKDSSELRIVSPFIKEGALKRLLSLNPGKIQVITRFNLNDFAEGVSDIKALQMLLDAGASVRGIKNLHAKLYLFGTNQAIITSANLTKSALDRNHEFGLVTEDTSLVKTCLSYFGDLWQQGKILSSDQIDSWMEQINNHHISRNHSSDQATLEDFGADVGIAEDFPTQAPTAIVDAPQSFVKFLGKNSERALLSSDIAHIIKKTCCRHAVHYPKDRRPRIVQDGAVIFIARLTREPNDIRIFGRAIGMKYQEGRDDASPEDIRQHLWKGEWPHCIRIHHAKFVAGPIGNGVSLNELMSTLGTDSFMRTQERAASGEKNINPKQAYSQHPAVLLSEKGFSWLNEKLQIAFDEHGIVPQDTLNQPDQPEL